MAYVRAQIGMTQGPRAAGSLLLRSPCIFPKGNGSNAGEDCALEPWNGEQERPPHVVEVIRQGGTGCSSEMLATKRHELEPGGPTDHVW